MKLLNFKQPLSLKWKWGILLWFMFSVIGLAGIWGYRHVSQIQQQHYLIAASQQKLEHIKSNLEQNPIDLEQNSIPSERLNFVEDDETALRFFNRASQLVYETKRLDVPAGYNQDTIQLVHYKGNALLLATVNLYQNRTDISPITMQYVQVPLRYVNLMKEQVMWSFWLSVIVIIAAAILAFSISHYFLLPLNYLNNALDMVEEESLSAIRIRKPRSNDEWSDLNIHINRLLDRIDSYVQNQKQFVEDVSHELRTPVAIVEGHLKMLNRWGKDDPVVLEESIGASLQEITRMKDLVQMMLDLSRAEHAEVDYKDEITEVYSATRQVFSNFVMLYPNFRFYLDSESEENELYVRMYKNHFEQILIILLDNAVKYSTERQEVHIAVSKSFTTVEIAVQDFGEGMSEQDKERVFGRFYRVDKARSREKGGNGLGLSIAKQLVESYKGKIYVESVLGHGSIFYIEFPIIVDKSEIHKRKQQALKKSL